MNYGNIKKYDIADGPGVRVSLFVSGCRHHCKGCFNPETWDFAHGEPYTEKTEKEILEALKPGYIAGFTVLGGEPFEPENQVVLKGLLAKIKNTYPEKDIWCYSGYTYEQLLKRAETEPDVTALLNVVDVLVDGPFLIVERDLELLYRGSRNQRLIDLKAMREKGDRSHVILWQEM